MRSIGAGEDGPRKYPAFLNANGRVIALTQGDGTLSFPNGSTGLGRPAYVAYQLHQSTLPSHPLPTMKLAGPLNQQARQAMLEATSANGRLLVNSPRGHFLLGSLRRQGAINQPQNITPDPATPPSSGSGTESGTGTQTGTGPGTGSGTDTATGGTPADPGTPTDSGTDTGTVTPADPGTGSGSDAGSGTDPGTDTGTGSGTETGSESGSGTGSQIPISLNLTPEQLQALLGLSGQPSAGDVSTGSGEGTTSPTGSGSGTGGSVQEAPVPEPGSWAIFALAIAAMSGCWSRGRLGRARREGGSPAPSPAAAH
jgi:hypothetical protein